MSRMRIIIGVLLLLGSVLASAACTANTLPAPVVLSPQNTAVPLQLATGTNSGDAFYIPAGQTNNVISKYTRNTGVTTTLTGQFGPSTTMVDGSSANARIVSLSALTYCDTAGMVYFIDSGTTLRKVDSTGTVSTVLTDKRLSTSSLMTCSGTTLVMSGGPCLLSMSTAAASPSLSLIVGDCNTNATSITNGQSWTSTIPFISGLAAFGSSYVAYTAAVGLIIMDTSQSRVNTGPTITGTFSGIATAGSTTMVFTVGTCTIQVMQFTGSLPTVYAQVPTGATASVCTSYRWLAASAAGPGESENFVVLYGSQNGGALFQEAACGPASATTATTTAAPQSGGGGGGGGSDNTSTIVIAVVVSAAAVIIIVIIIVVVVVLKRAPAAQEQSSPQAAAQPAVEMQPMAQNTMAAPNSSVSDPTASHNNTPFNSLPRPAVNTAPNLSYPGFNSPGNTGGTVAASGSFLGQSADTYPPKAVEPATPGGSVSNQKRALTSSQMQGQGVVLAAVSHSDFANSGMEVTESDIRRHNKRCEYVAAGAYQKGKLLGRGANGSVYAVLLKDGSTIAMKEVYLVGSEEEIRVQMRDNEAEVQLLRELHHANLVTYYGVLIDQANLQLNIFMECVTGGSLGAMVRGMNERLSEDTARVFTHQIVQGLAFIHSHGIVHRDLKCDNILRDSHTGLIKLADFGTAKNVGNATNASRAAQTMIGTPYFMAPEILMAGMGEAQDAGYGIKADVWSLGITVAEMLNRGVPPWPAFPSPGHAFLHISSPQGIPIMPDGLSPECEDFIRRCTDRDPKTRISSSELLLHPWIAHVES